MNDDCGTVKTSICKIRNRLDTNGFVNMMYFQVLLILNISGIDVSGQKAAVEGAVAKEGTNIAAAIEEQYHYMKCCVDETGKH